MGRPRTISRESVLQAAGALAGELGVSALTLEAVAARAGISKGGLQYLFKTKQQLLEAMIEYYSCHMSASVAEAYEALPDTPGRPLKAYILGSLEKGVQRDATTAALLSAALAEPELLAPGRKQYRKNLDELRKQGVPRNLALVVLCAVDGLMITEFMQLEPFTAAERKRLVATLLELAETGSVAEAAPAGTATQLRPPPRRLKKES